MPPRATAEAMPTPPAETQGVSKKSSTTSRGTSKKRIVAKPANPAKPADPADPLTPYDPEKTECEFALNHGVVTYDRGHWLEQEHKLRVGDTGVDAWHVTSCARDPKNMGEWITLYEHVNLRLALGLDAAQTPMCWTEGKYGEELQEELDEESMEIADKVNAFLKTPTEGDDKPVLFQTKHLALHASPITCNVVPALSYRCARS